MDAFCLEEFCVDGFGEIVEALLFGGGIGLDLDQLGERGPPDHLLMRLLVEVPSFGAFVQAGEPADVGIAPPALGFVVLDAAAFRSAGKKRDANAGGGSPGVFAFDADKGEGLAEGSAEAKLIVERDGALVDSFERRLVGRC